MNNFKLLALRYHIILFVKTPLTFIILFFLGIQLYGQEKKIEKDSTDIYKKIENYSEKSKFTKLIHRWIFRPSDKQTTRTKRIKPNYRPYEGKTVRKIIINSLDPFGQSVSDTTRKPSKWIERFGNSIHIKSKDMAIRNFLLLKEDQPLDTFLIAESARLLRAQNYIREVKIQPSMVPSAKDSVDVTITTLDSWSLIPEVSLSTSQTKLGFRERNIMGTGHEFDLNFAKRLDDGKTGLDVSYTVPNFKNTFINGTVAYRIDYDGYFEKKIAVERPFYSPLTRWAGGVSVQEDFLERTFYDDSLALVNQDLRFFTHDYWLGHSFNIFKGNTKAERSTNLILTGRALFVDYKEKPPFEYDSIRFFSEEKFFLMSTGIASRQFVEDSYIFKDGRTEDVPIGLVYAVTGGIQYKNQVSRPYLGGQIFYGDYFNWGFLSSNCELGTFFNGSNTEQTAISINLSYFSHLLNLGEKWKMRQFVKPQMILGVNRLNSIGDRLSLNEDPGFSGIGNGLDYYENAIINGFDSYAFGTSKYVLALQTQFYSPWDFWGFRLNPFINFTAGMLKGGDISMGTNQIYSSIGVGCIIRNDYLVFDSFQLSLTYYPQVPGEGDSIFKTNSLRSDDFGFQDFQIGKPHTVIYK